MNVEVQVFLVADQLQRPGEQAAELDGLGKRITDEHQAIRGIDNRVHDASSGDHTIDIAHW